MSTFEPRARLPATKGQMKSRKRIAVVSDRFSGFDAGDYARFTDSIVLALSKEHDVLHSCTHVAKDRDSRKSLSTTQSHLVRRGLGLAMREFSPDLVVYIPSVRPATSIFLRAYRLRRAAGLANHVMVLLAPIAGPTRLRSILSYLYPEPILVPSYKALLVLSRLSLNGGVVPLGVDDAVFHPVNHDQKAALRKRLGIERNDFVFLLAPACTSENLDAVSSLREKGATVVLAGSNQARGDKRIESTLTTRGVRVMSERCALPEMYQLADCFVFWRTNRSSGVQFPMCVLEALSTGIPVLSTPFGGLRDFLGEGDDVRYWRSKAELIRAAKELRHRYPVNVRGVTEFTWERVAAKITDHRGR